jgi:hypothetical protein
MAGHRGTEDDRGDLGGDDRFDTQKITGRVPVSPLIPSRPELASPSSPTTMRLPPFRQGT